MPLLLVPLILLYSVTFASTIKLPKYSLAIDIERQLKNNFGTSISNHADPRKSRTYNLLEDLIASYTQSSNRIVPIIAQNIKLLSKQKLNNSRKRPTPRTSKTINNKNCWELTKSGPNNQATCSVQLTVPQNTVLARVVNRDNPKLTANSPYTCIQVLNTLRRTNPKGIEMIYYKSNLQFEQLLSIASLPTLVVGVLIDYPILIYLLSYATFGSTVYLLKGFIWRLFITVITSRIFWHPTVYNIWCNIYYKTSGPAKLFTLKQILDNIIYICSEIYKVLLNATISLESILMERDLRNHIQSQVNQSVIIIDHSDNDHLFQSGNS